MNFCKECGSPLQEKALFCKECGQPVNESTKIEPAVSKQDSAPVVPKQPMSKKTKMMWISIGAAFVLLFGVHVLINSLLSKERLIDGFHTALIDQNAEDIAEYLTSSDKELKIDEKSVAGLLRYFKENPDVTNKVVTGLNEQSQLMDQPNFALAIDSGSYNLVQLQKDGKFLFYDRYKLAVDPVYLTIETNYKDTTLFVDDKEIATTDTAGFSQTFGPFLPGHHNVKAELKADFVDLERQEEILLMPEYGTETIGLYLEADEVTVDMPAPESSEVAKLYINGNDVGINPLETPTFGPVLTDGSMTLSVEIELPWGTMKTEEQPIERDYVDVNLMNDELQTTLMDTVHKYNQEWSKALTSVDTGNLTSATKAMQENILEDATYNMENEQVLEMEFQGSAFDLDSIYLSNVEGIWTAGMDVDITGNFTSYDIEYPEYAEDNTEWSYNYELQYDEDSAVWLVSKQENGWGIGEENVKEYTVEEPVIHKSVWVDGEAASSAATNAEDVDAGEFVKDFRDAYEKALNSKDFSLIENYLEPGSHAYNDLNEYVGDLKDTAYHYEFTSNEVKGTEKIDDSTIEVITKELFVFTNHLDEQIDYDREKTYTLNVTEEGYKISSIDYVETNRD
ncbi:zinc ribbon domain-containing protein [Oceanobacillus damuensis]|uniref:zinc ribbon domain-containing protein n=1 Tax=Oceanobacillus damuensis TaxID=937928 RepID=UPI0008359DCD|nr:hypothetical protein [Oceanobacillus damuensis]